METARKISTAQLSTWKNICLDFMGAYQDHQIDQMMQLCNQEATVYFESLGEAGRGTVHQLGKSVWSALIESFPDLNNTVHTISMENGKVVCNVSIRGTQHKSFADIPSQGNVFDSGHIFVFSLDENHQIKEITIQWDHEDLVRQLTK